MDSLLLISIALFWGFAGGKLSNKLKFPAVIGYIIFGVVLGPSLLNVFSLDIIDRMGIISDFALGIVAFSIGNELRYGVLKKLGLGILTIILAESIGAFLVVGAGVYLLTGKIYIALIFAALAPASAPAGTWVVLREYKARGPLTNTILAVVGLDDALAIIIYGLSAGLAKALIENKGDLSLGSSLITPLIETGGSALLGLILGVLMLLILRKLNGKEELLIVSLAGIMLCTGLSNVFHFSIILSNMVLAATMTNMYLLTSRKAVETIEKITPPVYVLFFVLAGAHLQIGLLPQMGLLGLVYIVGRVTGLMGGAYVGATMAGSEENVRKYLGLAILSQAGVAVGLAILVGREFGGLGAVGSSLAVLAINTIAATTIIFEIIGPLTTKVAIIKSGEAGKRIRRE